jgi:hypothetical protein
MRRPPRPFLPALSLAALALALASPLVAGEIYTWKDARGVTHYADAPPPGKRHSVRPAPGRPAAPKARAVVNADCSNARSNVALLQGTALVGLDADGDGRADREITAAERAERLVRARAQLETYCEGPAANAVTTTR